MEVIKDLFSTIGNRVRSHFFGSILLSFILCNWKPIYYLLNSDAAILDRFAYVDQALQIGKPLVIGIVLAISAPWIAWAGAMLATIPSAKIRSIQDKAASDRTINKIDLEAKENEAIANAARAIDTTLGEIEDEGVKDKFREDTLSDSAKLTEEDVLSLSSALVNLGPDERYILKRMGDTKNGLLVILREKNGYRVTINGQPLRETRNLPSDVAIQLLEQGAYIESMNEHLADLRAYQLTESGRQLAKLLRN